MVLPYFPLDVDFITTAFLLFSSNWCGLCLCLSFQFFFWFGPVTDFPTDVVYACAYVVCWSCGGGLATGRMLWCMKLGGRVLLDQPPASGSYLGTAWRQVCTLPTGWWQVLHFTRGLGRVQLLCWCWDGEGSGTRGALRLSSFWTSGQSIWEASYWPNFPTDVVCTCAYVVCCGWRGGLSMVRIYRCEGLDRRVGLACTASIGWQRLVRSSLEHCSSFRGWARVQLPC